MRYLSGFAGLIMLLLAVLAQAEPLPHVVFIAGKPSHPYGEHQHHAGGALLVRDLNASGLVRATLHTGGWPDDGIAADAATVVMYLDGDGGHDSLDHLEELSRLMDRGVGLVAIHYATHLPEAVGDARYLHWLGGYYNSETSTNPHWQGQFQLLEGHPVSRGVPDFNALDEFYFNIRFREGPPITPILRGTPPDEAREHIPHPRRHLFLFGGSVPEEVSNNRGREETVAWAIERNDGGRAFGFTGGHFHWNWGRTELRRMVLNAIVWTAGAEVPQSGMAAAPLSVMELAEFIEEEPPGNFSAKYISQKFKLPIAP